MKRDYLLILLIAAGLAAAGLITRARDAQQLELSQQISEQRLYLKPPAMKRLVLSFNGVAADWYWIRSLQYVGRKIVAYEDTHEGRMDLKSLASLDLGLLPSLLSMSATLDPQFMEPYYYGAFILPEIDRKAAISILRQGITANPEQWRLYQHLGYIYWQGGEYEKAGEVYAAGAKLPGAPEWMAVMSGRMKAEGGSRDAAREMYRHLYEATNDNSVKEMVTAQLMRLDALDQQEVIQQVLLGWATRSGRCALSWRDVAMPIRSAGLSLDANTLAPLDPSGVPYRLIKNGCDVELSDNSRVPRR